MSAGLAFLMAGFLALGAWAKWPVQDHSKLYLSSETFRSDYEALPPDALVITGILWFHYRAFQDIYRLREDVTVLGMSDFFRPEWFNPITAERFPRVEVPPDPFHLAADGEYLKRFLAANLDKGRKIYWEPFDMEGGAFYPNLKPELDLLFHVSPEPVAPLPPEEVNRFLTRLREKLTREIEKDGFLKDIELHAYYVSLLMHAAEYFQRHGFPEASISLLELLLDLFGPQGTGTMWYTEEVRVNVNLAAFLIDRGRIEEAQARLERALALNKYDPVAWANLGQVYLKKKQLPEAKAALEEALRLKPDFPEVLYNLGEYYMMKGDIEEARRLFKSAMEKIEQERVKQKIKKRLESLPPAEAGGES